MGKMNPIEAFYADSTVLVTGGTGFLGSVLIEKLLRSFSVKKIFLLIRSKKGLDVEHRMENFINLAIFDLLRTKSPSSFEKIVPVEVDYSKPDLSINLGLLTTIRLEVQIIFNVVASVKFNEALKDAISINILGTKKVVDMALHLKDLKAFVHVSTIFSNCNRSEIDEKIYSSTMSYQQFIHTGKVYENLKDPNEVEAPVFDNLPNTYTLTKHYAEKLVYHQAFFLPSGIFRPPIVISSYKDFAGYTDNLNGPSGIIVWTVRGYVHCIHGDGSARANLVPVDYCINAMIATAWDIHENFKQRMQTFSGAPIYNYIFHENNLTWNQLMQLVPLGFHQPLRKSIWIYSYFIVRSKALFKVLNFIYHTLPAAFMDCLCLLLNQKRIYLRSYEKLEKVLVMMSFFGKRQWQFGNENILRISKKTENFTYRQGSLGFDARKINWQEYFINFIPGIKRYFLKEDLSDIRTLRVQHHFLKQLHVLTKYVIVLILAKKCFSWSKLLLRRHIRTRH